MAISLSKKGRLAVKEQASSWGTSETSFSATDYVEAEGSFIPTLNRETLAVDTYRPDNTKPTRLAGSKAGTTFTLRIPMHGVSSTAPTNDPTIHPDATILKAILGGAGADGYNTGVAAGSTTSLVNFTNGQADTAWAGFAQLAAGATTNVIWWAKTVDTGASPDTVTPAVTTLTEAPAAGTAYGSYVLWLATTQATPLTIDWLGTDSTAHIRYYDALPSKVTITLAAKQQPMLEVEFYALNWTNVGANGAPADYAYTYPMIPAFMGTNGARALFSGGSSICPKTVVIELTQALSEAECAPASQGVDRLICGDRSVMATVTVNPSDLSATPWTDAPGATKNAMQIDVCNTPGRALTFLMPAPQVASQPSPVDNGGLIGLTSVYEPLTYSGDTGSTAPADTAFRIAFL